MQPHPDHNGPVVFGANGPMDAGQAVSDQDKVGRAIVVWARR
jgi:simple sugar transport system substrate-binding protein